jgi:SAM-dependent methyltransferase
MIGKVERYSRKLRNASWELRLNIRTSGVDHDVSHHPDAVPYEALGYPAIWTIFDELRMGPADVFVDIGCGKGRVTCCAARLGVRRVVGLEVNPRLALIARKNAARMRGRHAPITILDGPAEEADIADGTVFFLFNPFGEPTCRKMAASIEAATADRDTPARIVYVLPRHREAFEESRAFETYDTWAPRPEVHLTHPTVFLRGNGSTQAGRTTPFPLPSDSIAVKSDPRMRDSRSNAR